jgi:restriction system protein
MSTINFKKTKRNLKRKKYKKSYKENYFVEALFIGVFIIIWGKTTNIINTNVIIIIIAILMTATLYEIIISLKQRRAYLNLSQDKIDMLSGKDFESYLCVHFQKMGYKVRRTPDTNDYGADLLLYKDSEKVVVQAKRYKNKVGVKAINEVLGALHYYNCNRAIVVTNSFYTQNAIKMANKCNVELWDRTTIKKLFKIC